MNMRQVLRANHNCAKLDEKTARMLYITKRNKNGHSHPITKRAREELLAANASLCEEKAKRILNLLPKTKGKRKAILMKELANAEAVYNLAQYKRGL